MRRFGIVVLYFIKLPPQNINVVFLITLPPDALSTAADMAGAHGGSHVKDPPPPSSPSPELNQLSKSQEAGIASKSERSIGPKHDWKNIPSQIEAQTAVRSSESLSLDDPTPAQASLRQEGNITSKAVSLSKPVLAGNTGKVIHQYVMCGCVCTVQELDVYASLLKWVKDGPIMGLKLVIYLRM